MWSLPSPPLAVTGSLIVAYSGGLDSTVLLHRLTHDERFAGRVRAVHVHHGLHTEADAWAIHCERQCAQWRVPLQIVRVDVERDRGEGLEAAARHARYAAFAHTMTAHDVLLTAHHRDDQAETFLLRALRASGVDGLAAMRPWRRFAPGWHWRPLLGIARAALLDHAQRHALSWIEDPANACVDHDRNFLRHHVLPLLRQRWPQTDAAFARSAALSADAVQLLAEEDTRALASAARPDRNALCLNALQSLPRERRARVLREWLRELGLPPLPAEGIACIEQDLLVARADAESQFLWRDAVIRRWRDRLHAERQTAPLPAQWSVHWDTRFPLLLPTGDTLQLESAIPWAGGIRITARSGGERLRLPGRAHSHALKKLLQTNGIPPWERHRLPLLWDADGELLAAGDRLVSARLDTWLRTHEARLHWQRANATAR